MAITGVAIKTKPVLARPAKEGEVITTYIKGEGLKLFRSQPKRVIGLYKIFVQQQVMKKFWSEKINLLSAIIWLMQTKRKASHR
ncbi:hypothetical protein I3679_008520 [Proteus mirabilis]|uniref:Uncharacterized protein n=1 Tax=Proteus mirabilis TaxID=584 RepID=A0ABD5LS47_PROMI